jgi:hypothetical protein
MALIMEEWKWEEYKVDNCSEDQLSLVSMMEECKLA